MIDYQLAQKLKDAGFPWCEDSIPAGIPYIPTLSELNEACGDGFESLRRNRKGLWIARGINIHHKTIQDNSPEIAVSKLWLKLNSK